jgi:hypothetical protein
MVGEPFDGVADASGLGDDSPHLVSSVGIHGRTDVPYVDCMGVPSFSFVRILMAKDEGYW